MEWVAISTSIDDDTITHRMAEALRVRIAEAVGLMTLTFAKMSKHAATGNLSAITDTQLEKWAAWQGKRGAFATLFRAEFCNADGVVRAWEEYNGAHIREADRSKQRNREWRAARKAARDAARTPSATASATRPERVADAATGQDRTGQDLTTTATTTDSRRVPRPAPTGSWLTELHAAHEALYGAGSFAPLAGQFAKHWRALVAAHGGSKCAAVWTHAHRFASDKERPFLTPQKVAAAFGAYDPDRIVDGEAVA